jgi:UrcA family protein
MQTCRANRLSNRARKPCNGANNQGNIIMYAHLHRCDGFRNIVRHVRAWSFPLRLIAVLFALVTATPSAIADSHSQPERVSATVSLSDLDLTTDQGVRVARERLTKQALHLCRTFSDPRRVSDRQTVADCVHDAVAEALQHTD